MNKIILEGTVDDVAEEDSGQAMIARIEDARVEEFFVQLQSWSEERRHSLMRNLAGKRVRVTVETID
jgi:NifB/MoaA-like Fe-S oxidoreductase